MLTKMGKNGYKSAISMIKWVKSIDAPLRNIVPPPMRGASSVSEQISSIPGKKCSEAGARQLGCRCEEPLKDGQLSDRGSLVTAISTDTRYQGTGTNASDHLAMSPYCKLFISAMWQTAKKDRQYLTKIRTPILMGH